MEQIKIDRINELAKLAKQRGLPAEEAAERAALRKAGASGHEGCRLCAHDRERPTAL